MGVLEECFLNSKTFNYGMVICMINSQILEVLITSLSGILDTRCPTVEILFRYFDIGCGDKLRPTLNLGLCLSGYPIGSCVLLFEFKGMLWFSKGFKLL